MAITLSLFVCRVLYENFFGVDIPGDMLFSVAATKVFKRVSHAEFDKLVAVAKQEEAEFLNESPYRKEFLNGGK